MRSVFQVFSFKMLRVVFVCFGALKVAKLFLGPAGVGRCVIPPTGQYDWYVKST